MPDHPYLTFRRAPLDLDRAALQGFAAKLRERVAPTLDFHCLVTTDAELRRLNSRYRGRNYATDVLSFPDSNDIAISWGRARAQASEFGHTAADEICILMLHGLLHLLGMDHERDNGRMARAEAKWRSRFGLPSGLIARAR